MREKKDIMDEITSLKERVIACRSEGKAIEDLPEGQKTPELLAKQSNLANELNWISNRLVEDRGELSDIIEREMAIMKSIKIKEMNNNNNNSDSDMDDRNNSKKRRRDEKKTKKIDPDQDEGPNEAADGSALISFLIVLLPIAAAAGGIKGLLDYMMGLGVTMPLEAFFKCRDAAWDHKGYVVKFAEKDIPLFRSIITQVQTLYGYIPRVPDMVKFVGNCYTLKVTDQLDRSTISPTDIQEFMENKYALRVACVSHSRPYGKNHLVNFFIHLEFMEDARRLHNLPAVQIYNNVYATLSLQWRSVFNSYHGENACVLIGRNINYSMPDSNIDNHLKEAMRVKGYERDHSFYWIKPRDLKGRIINHKIWVHAPSEEHAEAITSTEWESNGIIVHWDRAVNRDEE